MKTRVWEAVCALFLGAAMANALCVWFPSAITVKAQSIASSSWVGVWQGELDGLPSVILTLAADDGTLQGTLVLNGINSDVGGPHIAVRETHLLLHPALNGMTLSFAVKGLRAARTTMNFTVEQTSNTSAKIHCLNCGEDAPTVEITKLD